MDNTGEGVPPERDAFFRLYVYKRVGIQVGVYNKVEKMSFRYFFLIGHVLNEQGTGYEYLKSIELKNGARHLKEHPNIITKIGLEGQASLQSILSYLILVVLKSVPCLCVLTNNSQIW